MKIINRKQKENRSGSFSIKKLMKVLVIILLVLALFFYRDTLKEIMEGIRQVTWVELGIGIFLSFLGYSLEGAAISVMAGASASRLKTREGVFIAFVCEFYRLTTLGNGSGIAEIHYLHKKKIEPGSAAVLTVVQYMVKRAAIMFFGIAGFFFLLRREDTRELCRKYAVFMGAGCLITLVVIAFLMGVALWPKATDAALWVVKWLSDKIPSQKGNLEKGKEQILLLGNAGKSILRHRKKILGVFCLQIGKLTAFYLIPAVVLNGKTELTGMECVLVMAIAFMLAGVIPAPSGAGALEFVFLLFFTFFANPGGAVPAILLFRFATWVCPAICGGALLLIQDISGKMKKR